MPSFTNAAPPPEVDAILKKLFALLEDDNDQNKALPELIRAAVAGGLSCDELPNARGEFGRFPSNPIPTNGPLGEVMYLSRLRTETGSPVMFHRLRAEEGVAGPVDVYEVLSLDGKIREILFLSMYHPRKSKKVPSGYTYAAKLDPNNFMYGVSHIVAKFPEKLDAHIRKLQMDRLGVPLPVMRVREAVNGSAFGISVLDEAEDVDRTTFDGRIRDDFLKLVHASQDSRFKDKSIAIGTDGLVRPLGETRVDDEMTGEEEGRLNRALRSFGETADMVGQWSLDQFVRRHAPSSTLIEVAREIDKLRGRERRNADNAQRWTILAIVSAVAVLSVSSATGINELHQSALFWITLAATAVGLIGRYLSCSAASAASVRISSLNNEHFGPHGVIYVPEGAMVWRDSLTRRI